MTPPHPKTSPSPKGRSPSPARIAAWRALASAWDPKGAGVAEVLDAQAVDLRMDVRDRGLAREIAYGVLRRRQWLEEELAEHMAESLASKSQRAHDAMLMGAYQLLFLDRVPAHAAVAESVELVSTDERAARFRGLVNAVLRKIARQHAKPEAELPWPVRESMPTAVVEALASALPAAEVEAFASASNQPAPLCLRLTRQGMAHADFMRRVTAGALRVSGEEISFRRGTLAGEECLVMEQGGFSPAEIAGFAEGWLTVEDEGAQVAALLAGTGAEGAVLDLCASPGGKTSHLADVLPESIRIVASDVSDSKLKRLDETLTRLGLQGRIETMLSARALGGDFNGEFAAVLVDAPCSGLGTLRRHPEIRYRYGSQSRAKIVQTQAELLKGGARLVAVGGVLVYTVCTVNRAECEDQVAAFLAAHRDFAADGAPQGLPFDETALRCGAGMWRTWPHRHGCDGFFIARMRRS